MFLKLGREVHLSASVDLLLWTWLRPVDLSGNFIISRSLVSLPVFFPAGYWKLDIYFSLSETSSTLIRLSAGD